MARLSGISTPLRSRIAGATWRGGMACSMPRTVVRVTRSVSAAKEPARASRTRRANPVAVQPTRDSNSRLSRPA
ncbi:hypothetical protein GCM10009647_045680 [Streptomyces sanglieri]